MSTLKKSQEDQLSLLDSKMCYESRVRKKDSISVIIQTELWNAKELPEIDLHLYGNLIFDRKHFNSRGTKKII